MVYRPIKKIPNSSDHIVRLNHLDMTSVEMGGGGGKKVLHQHYFSSQETCSLFSDSLSGPRVIQLIF